MNRFGINDLGVGIGLRPVHFGPILSGSPEIDWFEVLSENYLDTGGRPLAVRRGGGCLSEVRRR